MDTRKFILQETAILALGQAVCVGAIMGLFALMGHFDSAVLLGGILGAAAAILNFFFMAISAMSAADKAQSQNVPGGKATIRASYLARTILLFVFLFVFAKSGLCNVFALVLPLIFVRPLLFVREFIRKPGEDKV